MESGTEYPGKAVSHTVINITIPALGTGAAPADPKDDANPTFSHVAISNLSSKWTEWAMKLMAQGNPMAVPSLDSRMKRRVRISISHMLIVAPRGRRVLAVVSSTKPDSTAVRMEIGNVAALEAVENATIIGCLIA
jgi:hypothetical protein